MSASHQSGRLLMLRVKEARWSSSLERLLRKVVPGGVVLDGQLSSSPEAAAEFLRRIAAVLPHHPFLALGWEGGTQDPLKQFFPGLPSARAASEKSLAAVALWGELFGEGLSLLGFNANFAPVLDLATPSTGKTFGERTFGSEPGKVTECGRAFLRGFEKHRILACGKHFPGLGSVPPSNAARLPVSGKPMAALWREDLLPYRRLLPRLPMILMSSAGYKAYDFDRPRPACLSPLVVEGLLRQKLGYHGLVLAHDLESKRVRGNHSIGDVAVQSIVAGCDMIMLDPSAAPETLRALEAAVGSGKISSSRLRESLARIEKTEKKLSPIRRIVSRSGFAAFARKVEALDREFQSEEKNDA